MKKKLNMDKYIKGAGNKFVLIITYDDTDALGEALQNVMNDIRMGKMFADEASDTYAYGFEIEGAEHNKQQGRS